MLPCTGAHDDGFTVLLLPLRLPVVSTTSMVFFVICVTCASSPWCNLPTLPSARTISPPKKRSTTSLLPTALASPGVAVLGACAPTPDSASRAAAPGS